MIKFFRETQRKIMNLLLFIFLLTLPADPASARAPFAAQADAATAQAAASPESLVKDFYRWYIDRLNKDRDPLTQEKSALQKYLTPEFFRKAPKLLQQTDADVFICAQDWDKDWGKNVAISRLTVQGAVATMNVTLSGKTMKHRLKVKVKQLGGVWKIDRIDPLDL
jgi:hypothetical protein